MPLIFIKSLVGCESHRKTCARCGIDKDIIDFSVQINKKILRAYINSYCKKCSSVAGISLRKKKARDQGVTYSKYHKQSLKSWPFRKWIHSAKQRGGVVKVTAPQIEFMFNEQGRKCAITKVPLVFTDTTTDFSPSIDRIDNTGIYEIKNIRWVAYKINTMKLWGNDSQLLEWCRSILNLSPIQNAPVISPRINIKDYMRIRASKIKYRFSNSELTTNCLMELYSSQNGKCHMTNTMMTYGGRLTDYTLSVDRIDPNGIYCINNSRLVCYRVNIMRGKSSDQDLVEWCKRVVENING